MALSETDPDSVRCDSNDGRRQINTEALLETDPASVRRFTDSSIDVAQSAEMDET